MIQFDALFLILDTINTQVHEATKHTPYELVFGQPPRSLLVPDPEFRGRLEEEGVQASDDEADPSGMPNHTTDSIGVRGRLEEQGVEASNDKADPSDMLNHTTDSVSSSTSLMPALKRTCISSSEDPVSPDHPLATSTPEHPLSPSIPLIPEHTLFPSIPQL